MSIKAQDLLKRKHVIVLRTRGIFEKPADNRKSALSYFAYSYVAKLYNVAWRNITALGKSLTGWFELKSGGGGEEEVAPIYKGRRILPYLLGFKKARTLAKQPIGVLHVAGQVDHGKWKTGNIDQNLRQVTGICNSYFAALRVFSLRRLAAGAFAVPFRVLNREIYNGKHWVLKLSQIIFSFCTPGINNSSIKV